MQYRRFGRFGYRVSQLGFGAMRLPKREDGKVDYDLAVPLIRRGMDLGINFIDSHHFYHRGESEIAVGKAIQGRREQVYIQTKTPMYREVESEDERWRWLETALEKLGTDYIDFYLAHSFNWQRFQRDHRSFLKLTQKARDQGLIRHMGFSFHDTADALMKIINTDLFDCMTVQYNLLNRSLEEPIAHAHEKGMGVVIMGPVGGGTLAGPSEEIRALLPRQVQSSAEIALRFVLSNPHISLALSGMSTMGQLEENAVVASKEVMLTQEDRQQVREVLEEKQRLSDLYCTGCGYCMPCPNGVNIPRNFELMNLHRVYGLTEAARGRYQALKSDSKAEDCVKCGECEPKCPQKIPIMEQLEEVAAILGSSEVIGTPDSA